MSRAGWRSNLHFFLACLAFSCLPYRPLLAQTATFTDTLTATTTPSDTFTVTPTPSPTLTPCAPVPIIVTFAGNGVAGAAGDGSASLSANLNGPDGVAAAGNGDLYIADRANGVVRRVSGGIIYRFAGNYAPGFSGDGGQATAAQLQSPVGLAVAANGDVYVADSAGNRIRRVVASSGLICTFAGNGGPGFSGDGGQATAAQLNTPCGVALDALGNVYIADTANHKIRMVNPSGVITTFAGTGAQGFSGDPFLAV